jgi:hypothetical protein
MTDLQERVTARLAAFGFTAQAAQTAWTRYCECPPTGRSVDTIVRDIVSRGTWLLSTGRGEYDQAYKFQVRFLGCWRTSDLFPDREQAEAYAFTHLYEVGYPNMRIVGPERAASPPVP